MPRILTLTLAVLALTPSAAGAATALYASPTADDAGACTQESPCHVSVAVGFAQEAPASFEVVLLPGTYALTNMLALSQPYTLRGSAGTRPTITLAGTPVVSLSNGATLRDVRVEQTATSGPALTADNAKVDRVVVSVTGNAGAGAVLRNGTQVTSSAFLTPGSESRAVWVDDATAPVELDGVTISSGGEALAAGLISNTANVNVTNSILRGEMGDVMLSGMGAATIDHSAYRPAQASGVTDAGGNIAADPLLAADGFHQNAGSPTIDAGAPATGTDVDGEARTLGTAPDIGADERPPSAVQPPADPTPTPTPAPETAPTPTPTPETTTPPPPGDLTLPGILSIGFPKTPVAGKPSDLVIETFDPDSAILGLVIDLGPAGVVGLSACTTLKPSGPFVPGRPLKFTIPVVFPAPGLQSYTVEIRSGGCGGAQQVSRSEHSTQVTTGALVARTAQAARCAGTPAQATICLMNRERARRRLRPLTVNAKLVKSAAAHTADMLARSYYNHQRPGGPTLKARTRKARYRGNTGENLGLANGALAQPAQMMKMWMASPMHRANILQRRFRAVGVVVQAKDPLKKMKGAAIYTVNFGTKK